MWFLDTVLHGHMDCRQWDTFMSIPIKGDPKMEEVRQACEQLVSEEIIENDGRLYHQAGAKDKLERILSALKNNEPRTTPSDSPSKNG